MASDSFKCGVCTFASSNVDYALVHCQQYPSHTWLNWHSSWPRGGQMLETERFRKMDTQETNGVLRHKPPDADGNNGCRTNFNLLVFDRTCPRCSKIKIVIDLKRKTTAHGASEGEESAALTLADSIIDKYKLKRGEVFDRLYPPPTKEQFVEPDTSHGHKVVSRGGNAHIYGHRSPRRKDMDF